MAEQSHCDATRPHTATIRTRLAESMLTALHSTLCQSVDVVSLSHARPTRRDSARRRDSAQRLCVPWTVVMDEPVLCGPTHRRRRQAGETCAEQRVAWPCLSPSQPAGLRTSQHADEWRQRQLPMPEHRPPLRYGTLMSTPSLAMAINTTTPRGHDCRALQ